jgi:uncharacterized membrane protein YhaH (DUF805 family)
MGQVDFNKLWQNFLDTVTNHYMDFNGRMGRAQYWYFILVCIGVFLVAGILDAIVHTGLLGAIVGLGLLLPMGGMSARRMQDTGQSGQLIWVWIIVSAVYQLIALLMALSGPLGALAFLYFFISIGWLISLVSLVASIAVIYFCAQPGTAGENAFGPPSPPWTPGPAAT